MDILIINPVIQFLQNLSAEANSVLLLCVCLSSILLLLKWFGANGLLLYNIVAVLAANIQVLKGSYFTSLNSFLQTIGFANLSLEPVALGTIVFSTTYLSSDILTEYYGKKTAIQGVWYCFAAQILMTVLMISAVGYPAISNQTTHLLHNDIHNIQNIQTAQNLQTWLQAENAMSLLFTPSPRLLIASLIAFAISQLNDIWVFQRIASFTQKRFLWLRAILSVWISAVVDTVLFSLLAFVVLAPQPVSFKTLIFTYILGTVIMRAIIGIVSVPVIYISRHFLPIRSNHVSTIPIS